MPIDMSLATQAPPKKASAGRSAARSKATPITTPTDVESAVDRRANGLTGIAQLAQGICVGFGQYADGATIGMHGPPLAKEIAAIADSNEMVAKAVDVVIGIGPYGALLAVVMPFGLQIAANHGWVDPNRMMGQGVVPPSVLEAQMKAQVMRMQADAMRQQQQAIAEAQEAQRQMEDLIKAQQAA